MSATALSSRSSPGRLKNARLPCSVAASRSHAVRNRELCGRELLGHGGSIAVSTACVGFSPAEDLGIAPLANASPGCGLAEPGKGVFAALIGENPDELPFFARKDRLEELAGEYETYRGIKRVEMEIEVERSACESAARSRTGRRRR
ncbi:MULTISPECIES: hypothetical protein [Natrialbaceae]|uniref:hypothetical protein n=1 Tax=Natrialbaceae TaxID=1644061 RepID=UPI00207C786C|nr:hypothetical protein [Natronococcus sp. CG52]